MYIDWNLRSGFQAFDKDPFQAGAELADSVRATDPDTAAKITTIMSAAGFKDKELDQAWNIAKLGESGANTRAGISASASRYSADAGVKSSKIAADASKYGVDVGRLTDKERIALDRDLGEGRLGLDYATQANSMRGPANYLQQADFMRGASQRQDVPVFLQNMMRGQSNAGFQMPGGQPDGYNMQGLLAKMGINGTSGGTSGGTVPTGPTGQDASFLAAVRAQNAKGVHTLPPNFFQQLSPSELGAYQSASEYSGDGGPAWNWDDLMNQAGRAQVGNGNPYAA